MRYDVTLFSALYWTKFNLNSQTNRYVNSELIKKIELVFGYNLFLHYSVIEGRQHEPYVLYSKILQSEHYLILSFKNNYDKLFV